ncbi:MULTISPECIES: hypothetical protein [Actinopolyspora]|uniref:hypothetical protein n=1 Tax=Actinopolyspora TaxID=1849 RepID=UPI0013F61052|nr:MULTISPECIES: hypothetical protein [Actinopolyspora]NHD16711.1 hypothetical protein [Actinopolyspora sp. BKK2]NHE75426.1 hypothetical protein [Actinopolyspora sp. BKK1]
MTAKQDRPPAAPGHELVATGRPGHVDSDDPGTGAERRHGSTRRLPGSLRSAGAV